MEDNTRTPESVDQETAEEELDRFFKAHYLTGNWDHLPADDRRGKDTAKHEALRYIREGRLTFDDDSTPTYELCFPVGAAKSENKKTTVTFHRPKGDLFTSGDGLREEDQGKKLNRMLANLTQTSEMLFKNMEAVDHAACSNMLLLFLP